MWLRLPSTCSPCAQGPEGLNLLSDWHANALASSVLWRSKPSQPQAWRARWTKVAWMRRLSGLTSSPSTAKHGVDAWISSLRAIRASRSALQDAGQARTIPATSGPTLGASSSNAAPDGSCSKTLLATSPLALTKYGESYAALVSRLRQDYSQRRKWARRMKGNGSLSWPTPTSMSFGDSHQPGNCASHNQMIALWESQWPTAISRDHKSTAASQETHERNSRPLSEVAGMWATPTSHDGRRPGADVHSTQGGNLSRDTALWATPSVADTEGSRKARNGDQSDELLLNGQAAHCGLQAPETAPHGPKSNAPAPRLSPFFVEWLMGWPLGWTALTGSALSETEWCRWWALMQSELSRLALRPEATPERQMSLFEAVDDFLYWEADV